MELSFDNSYFFAKVFISGVLLFLVLLVFVFATGSTFGQICSADYEKETLDWQRCVANLSSPSTPKEPKP